MSKLIERHNEIIFNEKEHTYTRVSKQFKSVTTFINMFHEHFDAEAISTKLAKGDEVKKAKLKYDWAVSSPWGTYIHRLLEIYAQGFPVAAEDKQFLEGRKMYDDLIEEGWKLLMPELIVWDDELGLCGTCDLVFVNDNNEILLGDWKTCKTIPKTGFMGKKLFYPLQDVDDCKLSHYELQLSIYQYLIEKNTKYKVVGRELLHLPLEGKSKRIQTKYLRDEVRMALAWYKANQKVDSDDKLLEDTDKLLKDIDEELEAFDVFHREAEEFLKNV